MITVSDSVAKLLLLQNNSVKLEKCFRGEKLNLTDAATEKKG